MTESRVDRYRQLFTQIGQEPARALLDRLQVLALTQPDTLREFTALIDRGHLDQRFFLFPKPDRRRNPERRAGGYSGRCERARGDGGDNCAPLEDDAEIGQRSSRSGSTATAERREDSGSDVHGDAPGSVNGMVVGERLGYSRCRYGRIQAERPHVGPFTGNPRSGITPPRL